MALTGGERVKLQTVLANFTATTQDIADLESGGGGGGLVNQKIISAGNTDSTLTLNTYIGWDSPTLLPKSEGIPTSTGSLGIMVVSDLFGNAGQYPITIVPQSGSIIGPNTISTNFGSLTLLDTNGGWVVTNQNTGSGSTSVRKITSGIADSIQAGDGLIQWNSSDTGGKTETILGGFSNGQTIQINDGIGNAATYPITLTGSGVTIGGNTSLVLSDNFFDITLQWDNFSNWIITSYYNGNKTIAGPAYLLVDANTIFAIGGGGDILL